MANKRAGFVPATPEMAQAMAKQLMTVGIPSISGPMREYKMPLPGTRRAKRAQPLPNTPAEN